MTHVVVNSSPIIGLAMLGKLDLLWLLFDYVSIPQAVYDEVSTKNRVRNIGAKELKEAVRDQHIFVYRVNEEKSFGNISRRLHKGEIEVVAAAKELNALLVIIDDKLARYYAREQGFNTMGLIGLLLLAKKRGYVQEVKQSLDMLKEKGYRISEQIYLKVLKQAEETNL